MGPLRTIHAGVLLRFVPLTAKRLTGIATWEGSRSGVRHGTSELNHRCSKLPTEPIPMVISFESFQLVLKVLRLAFGHSFQLVQRVLIAW